ncbi:MAG: cytochrome c nitrite reductase small subunit [Ignavibacteria bacterium]|nr:cytochrome c nitrite reductase small subunit [Ignavibacteria bacterium]
MKNAIKKIVDAVIPPQNWIVAVSFIGGIFIGLAFLVLYISNAPSYLSDKPESCINCHVMTPQFITWRNSSHARVATCNDCHVPQDNIIRKLYFKSSDGLRHSFIFTFRLEPQVIQIKEAGKKVVQENCIRCHRNLIEETQLIKVSTPKFQHSENKLCWDCHRETPHGRVNSLASTPYARVPKLNPILPEWLSKFFEKEKN